MTHRTRYDDDFKTLVSDALKRGEQPLKIAEFLRCHCSTIYDYKSNLLSFGVVKPPSISNVGRPRKITAAVLEGLADFIDGQKSVYQDEMQDFLLDEFGIECPRFAVA